MLSIWALFGPETTVTSVPLQWDRPNPDHPDYFKATMTTSKDATWSTSGSQVLHIALTFSDHYVKVKVYSPLVGGAPELQAASSALFTASPHMQGERIKPPWIRSE